MATWGRTCSRDCRHVRVSSDGRPCISYGYWAEKCVAADREGIRVYSPTGQKGGRELLDDMDASEELRDAAGEVVAVVRHDEGRRRLHDRGSQSSSTATTSGPTSGENNFEEHTGRFLWCNAARVSRGTRPCTTRPDVKPSMKAPFLRNYILKRVFKAPRGMAIPEAGRYEKPPGRGIMKGVRTMSRIELLEDAQVPPRGARRARGRGPPGDPDQISMVKAQLVVKAWSQRRVRRGVLQAPPDLFFKPTRKGGAHGLRQTIGPGPDSAIAGSG